MTIDLHTHTNKSDGTDTPTELIVNSVAAGLSVVAITDHDSTVGWAEAEAAADGQPIELIRGIEISTELDGQSIHLLGYEFDPTNAALLAELDRILGGRDGRLPRMISQLQAEGIDITEDAVKAKAADATSLGRPHVADVLIDLGVVTERAEAFDKYLSPGKPGYVGRYAADVSAAVSLVKDAGGKAVLAHPWSRGSDRVVTRELIASLVELGLDGIEVDHLDHGFEQREALRHIARSHGLAVTGSSDYHGTGKPDNTLGCCTTARAEFERLFDR